MGCFSVLKCTKKKYDRCVNKKDTNRREMTRTKLPEPETRRPSLHSAPPSFRNRAKLSESASRVSSSRTRAMSAPSTLVVDQDTLYMELDDQEEYKGQSASNQRFSNPLPLPLPLPNTESLRPTSPVSPIPISGPLPLPPLGGGGIRNYSFEEVSAACQWFSVDKCISEGLSSTNYKATFGDDTTSSKKLEAMVTRLLPSPQTLKEFVNEVNTIASLRHPQLCKLIGFHAREGPYQRMLVYERLFHGSLDRLLYGRTDGPSIDWAARAKVALCAAQGLAFLHEEGPFQAMYSEFSAANIQVDKDFSAKLSGYGCVCYIPDAEILSTSTATANLSVETIERGVLTPKSNVWSFGIVLLELLTGRKNLDSRHPKEERNIVKWSNPFLADDCRLSLIIDPRIKGRCPPKAARAVADVAQRCLHRDPSQRPTMRAVVDSLRIVQDMKYTSRYSLQVPSAVVGKVSVRTSPVSVMPLPPLTCSSAPAMHAMRRPGVQGF